MSSASRSERQEWREALHEIAQLLERGQHQVAKDLWNQVKQELTTPDHRIWENNDAVIEAIAGEPLSALGQFEDLLAESRDHELIRLNAAFLEHDLLERSGEAVPAHSLPVTSRSRDRIRVAIVSFLFNWPSTGGGIVHTVELAKFLTQAGFDVQHFYPVRHEWGIGKVEAPLPISSQGIRFDDRDFTVDLIRDRFRQSIRAFKPDYVIITDAWNMKPVLADAVREFPFFLRYAALEGLCPLNNLQLLPSEDAPPTLCPHHQLEDPQRCHRCLERWGHSSGDLHRMERDLARVGSVEHDRLFRWALQAAEAVLVLNPSTKQIMLPYARRVEVVPWGMDPKRFPWPIPEDRGTRPHPELTTLFMAGLPNEYIKGFHVLHEACRMLRTFRTDFELVVTGDPPGRVDEFTRYVGWATQEELPAHYRNADLCIVPTVAPDGLSRTSVEAMASGLAVVGSRIGGLPYTITDGVTGLLFTPGDALDLARKLSVLLDEPAFRSQMGLAGRRRFEEDFLWQSVIERHYIRLLTPRRVGARGA